MTAGFPIINLDSLWNIQMFRTYCRDSDWEGSAVEPKNVNFNVAAVKSLLQVIYGLLWENSVLVGKLCLAKTGHKKPFLPAMSLGQRLLEIWSAESQLDIKNDHINLITFKVLHLRYCSWLWVCDPGFVLLLPWSLMFLLPLRWDLWLRWQNSSYFTCFLECWCL